MRLVRADGTLPWTADHERRGLIVRYTPGNTVYASPGGNAWPAEYFEDATDAQKALLEAPYHTVTATPARRPTRIQADTLGGRRRAQSRQDIGRPWLNDDGTFGGGTLGQRSNL